MTDTLEELKSQFLSEMTDDLEHSGVKGMHWGQRKAEDTSTGVSTKANRNGDGKNKVTGFFDRPNVAKAVLLGSYGKKSSYTDPAALKTRKTAGKLRIAAIIGSVGSTALTAAGKSSPGAQAIAGVLGTGAGLASAASIITGAVGAHQENVARNS